MLQMLIIAACIIVHMGDDFAVVAFDTRVLAAYLAVLAAMALVVQLICWRARVRMDRVGWGYARHMADRAIMMSRIACILLHALAVLGLGELSWIRANVGDYILLDEAICVLPVVLFVVAGWWSIYPLERRVREAMLYRELHAATDVPPLLARWAFVWARVREGLGVALIPIALATACIESLDRFGRPAIERVTRGTSLGDSVSMLHAIASTLVVVGVLAIAPALVRFAWDLVPMPDGQTRGAITSVMAKRRIRVIGPLVWRTGGDSVNAAVLGAIFPFRYMVFTDALLANLPFRQLQAVTAHEIAHVRLHHMPWMMVCVLASVYALGWVAALCSWGLGIPADSEAATMAISLAMLPPIAWLFGVVSRRMEWQADAYAARVLSELEPVEIDLAASPTIEAIHNPSGRITPEAAAAVAGALQTVADLNAMNPRARSFRHGSIYTRQRRVLALVGADASRLPIDRTVRRIKLIAVVALVSSATVHIGSQFL